MSERSEPDFEAEAEEQRMQNEVERLRCDLELLESPETIFGFGQLSFDGDGVEQDYGTAAGWFRIAAEQGHAKAQHNLAFMYEQGLGVPQDYSEAAKWYRMAAEQGHAGSQNNLGALFESGDGVVKDQTAAIKWYQRAAEGGDTNGRSNFKRLKALAELERYKDIVFAFGDLMAAHSPLIGDCALLPYPKATILYAIKFVEDDYETKRDLETAATLIESYGRMIPTINYLFTCLARNWHDIAPEDKDAIARLTGYDSFPEWALPLKRKYINEERASLEAVDAAFRVIKDKVAREKADENDTIDSENWLTHLERPERAHWEAKPQSVKDWWYANTKADDRGGILRTELATTASYNEFLHLPQATRDAITKRLDEQADAARIRIQQRLAIQPREGE